MLTYQLFKWEADDGWSVEAHAQFQQDGFLVFALREETSEALLGVMPVLVLYEVIVYPQVHRHLSATDRAFWNQLMRDPAIYPFPLHLPEQGLRVIGFGMAAAPALDQPIASLRLEDFLCGEPSLFKLVIGIGAEQKEFFACERIKQGFVQRCHVQVDPGQQRLMRPIAPLALLIGEGIEAGRIHILHVWPLAVDLLELGEVFLEESAAIFRARRCAHPSSCPEQHIVRFAEKLCRPVDLPGIRNVLVDIIPCVVSGEKI